MAECRRRFGTGTQPLVAPVPVPEGMRAGKRTVAYNGAGEVIAEWRQTHAHPASQIEPSRSLVIAELIASYVSHAESFE
jgi:hypothetical protein